MRAREKCGCVHDGHKWLDMCDVHRAEFNDTHERWAIEHVERQPTEVPEWLQNDPACEALAVAIVDAGVAAGVIKLDAPCRFCNGSKVARMHRTIEGPFEVPCICQADDEGCGGDAVLDRGVS